mmetsp:Transcript_62541/g.139640  ORF Transcript_62541/g.139640 Transcript_62541/m.139640 type:complete len:468 (+) Transcript_62541:1992-3395(+)
MVLLHNVLLQLVIQLLGVLRVPAHDGRETVLLGQELEEVALDLPTVQLEGVVAVRSQFWVEAVQGPIAGVDCHLAVLNGFRHREALADAGGISQDDAWARVCISLNHGPHCLLWVHVHANACDVDILVSHGQLAHVLLLGELAALRKLGHGALRSGLGSLTAGVAVHLRVQDQDVHVLLTGNYVIQAAVPDVVCPAVTTHDPEAAAPEHVLQVMKCLDLRMKVFLLLQQRLQLFHDLVVDATAPRQQQVVHLLLAHDQVLLQGLPELIGHRHGLVGQSCLHLQGEVVAPLLEGLAHAETELRVVLEKRIRPRRALALRVDCVGEGRIRTSPNGGATRGIGNDEPFTEELRHQLDMGGLSTTLTGTAELEVRLLELRALHGGLVNLVTTVRQSHSKVPIGLLLLDDFGCRLQSQSIGWANADAKLTAGAIPRRDLDAVLVAVQDATTDGCPATVLEGARSLAQLLVCN